MATPIIITATGKITKRDGTPETGTVTFQAPGFVRSVSDLEVISPGKTVATLDENGEYSIPVYSCTDPVWNSINWSYKIVANFSESRDVFDFSIPHDQPGLTIDFSQMVPEPPEGGTNYSPVNHTHPEYEGGGGGAVASVNGRTGAVTLTKTDVGLANVDNTSDANKPVSSAAQTALNLKAPLASPAFTGTPTGITKAHVGLSAVDNTSDANKPVSTATQTALDLKADASAVTTALGNKADLVGGVIPTAQIPAIAITEYLGAAANQAAMLALAGQVGDWAVRTDLATTWVITGADPTQLSSWTQLSYPTAPVTSVSGKTGVVTLVKADVGLANVDNTSDANKPVSTATQTALDLKAPIASPTFTGTVSGVTKSHVGLGNVDNTSDSAKPVSSATQTALDAKPDVYYWNGSAYVIVTTGDIYVGPPTEDPGAVGDGSVWVKTA